MKPALDEPTERQQPSRAHDAASSFRVVVATGPAQGRAIELGPSSATRIVVGKSAAAGLAIDDALASRSHLALEVVEGGLRATDLDSTNGTLVNGVTIAEATLRGGETITIGATELRVERVDAKAPVSLWPVEAFGRVRGASVVMRRLYPLFQKLAASELPLVIEGETGAGKELLAESLHEMGPRKAGPFVVFDCAAHADRELEAVLFGEQEISTTRQRGKIHKGLFEEADHGTLLIDEIAELPLVLQAKLLRAIERGEFSRVRGDGWQTADVRVIASTRRNLDREVEKGRFREDLYFRVAATSVELPPLRKRAGDVALLARHFWKQLRDDGAPFPADLLRAHEDYAWPGNVRELANLVARKVALGELDEASRAPLSPSADNPLFERVFELDLPFPQARARVLAEFERCYVERVLAKHDGNVSRAAAASGVARRYFQILRTRLGDDGAKKGEG